MLSESVDPVGQYYGRLFEFFEESAQRAISPGKHLKEALFPEVKTPPPVGEVTHVEGSLEAQAEKEQKRRLKQAAAIMLKDWEPPVLGVPGMLGVSG